MCFSCKLRTYILFNLDNKVKNIWWAIIIIIFQAIKHTPLAITAVEVWSIVLLLCLVLKGCHLTVYTVYSCQNLIAFSFKIAGKERPQLASVFTLIGTLYLSGRVKTKKTNTTTKTDMSTNKCNTSCLLFRSSFKHCVK